MVTDMKRICLVIPDDLDKQILERKGAAQFVNASYSELIRCLIRAGLEAQEEKGA